MREMIRIIKEHNSEYVDRSKINIQDVGQKAWGLCQMPVAWTPPFFVISSELYLTLLSIKDCEFKFNEHISRILEAITIESLGNQVIIRSSGYEEGMMERGKYDSEICDVGNLNEGIKQLIIRL